MKRFFKPVAVLLLISMLAAFVGCAESKDKNPTDDVTSALSETTADPDAQPVSGLPDMDLDGFTVTFVGKAPDSGAFGIKDVAVESETGDAFNDAVFRRNTIIEEEYNCVIEFVPSTDGAVINQVKPSILAADDYYDVIYDGLQPVMSVAQEGHLIDLYSLEYFDFSKPWWDDTVNGQLSVMGKLYVTYGEHMVGPKSGLYGLFFNKKLAENLSLGDIYQYVRDDKWTMDQFATLARSGNSDLNGDGKWTSEDQYGHITESYSGYTFMVAQGYLIGSKDGADVPSLTAIDSDVYAKVDKMMEVLADTDVTNFVGKVPGESDIWGAFWSGCFVADKFLFREGAMHDAPNLRNMDTDFGILPLPKYNEEQDRYYHTNSVMNAATMCIPVSASDPDSVSFVVEAMAYQSLYMLTPVYYDVVLQGKTFRDDESSDMLDIIFNSKVFDIGSAFNWGGIRDVYTGICTDANSNFASSYAKIEPKAISALEKTVEAFLSSEAD